LARHTGDCPQSSALDVEAENRDAVRLYERMGFVREAHDLRLMGRLQFARYSKPVGDI